MGVDNENASEAPSSTPKREDQKRGNETADPFLLAARRLIPDLVETVREGVQIRVVDRKHVEDFDLPTYESLFEHPDVRELGPEHWEAVGQLYQRMEIPSHAFRHLHEGAFEDAEMELQKGGMVDRWQPSTNELAALRSVNPRYVPSGEEFRCFLEQRHNRVARFRAWGLFDRQGSLRAISSAFVPPIGGRQRKQHRGQIERFFSGEDAAHFHPILQRRFDFKGARKHLRTMAECYLVGTDTRRGATVIFHEMLEALKREGAPITAWYLLRFGMLDRILPPQSKRRLVSSSENSVSGKFFEKRGFKDCGECVFGKQYAAREVGEGAVVVVQPTWRVMLAEAEKVHAGDTTEITHLHDIAHAKRMNSAQTQE